MSKRNLPLKEVSIDELYMGSEKNVYEIPIYQRNYAWEKDEISTLIQDVYDAYRKNKDQVYYIGTLVVYHKGDHVFEIIDGQQRLTTIRLILSALDVVPQNQLTYRARKKSDATLKSIPQFDVEEIDTGIKNGFENAKAAIGEIVPADERKSFTSYFRSNVHMIHYRVPKDIDLNHYFEIMNSRGEQLEKHEIVKAKLMQRLDDDKERKLFNKIWECCSEMSVYVQQNFWESKTKAVFGELRSDFLPKNFQEMMERVEKAEKESVEKEAYDNSMESISILDIMNPKGNDSKWVRLEEANEKKDSFQPIIDFPNLLLIVLKISRMTEIDFQPKEFLLDDKELLNAFAGDGNTGMNAAKVRSFAYNLLKVRFLLDNYMVHHSKEADSMESNPWKLQVWQKHKEMYNGREARGQLRNLSDDRSIQDKLVHLLSMFEVSFTARQRKNYLFYCLLYLMEEDTLDVSRYGQFVEELADRYFNEVYLDKSKLNAINTPVPGSFDEAILKGRMLDRSEFFAKGRTDFVTVYGDGMEASRGIPLFVFNYLDYQLWKLYDLNLRGEKLKEGSRERKNFFIRLGCSDFGLKIFDQFYFSRTRRSLEHYYPQAAATGTDGALSMDQINCFGNYAMIGSEANSSGSNWFPKTKLDHYLDASGKINQISVASLKFMIMMQICYDEQTWEFEEIKNHLEKMMDILFGDQGET